MCFRPNNAVLPVMCPGCGTANLASDGVCKNCGAPLPQDAEQTGAAAPMAAPAGAPKPASAAAPQAPSAAPAAPPAAPRSE